MAAFFRPSLVRGKAIQQVQAKPRRTRRKDKGECNQYMDQKGNAKLREEGQSLGILKASLPVFRERS